MIPTPDSSPPRLRVAALALFCGLAAPALAATPVAPAAPPTYADLATLADAAAIVARVRVASQAPVPTERAPGLRAGHFRLYIEAETVAALSAPAALPARLAYLLDVPADPKGRAPKISKREFAVFARPVAGRPGELQLVAPSAQLAWTPELEQRLRPIVSEFAAADVAPRVTGVRDVLSSAGNLAGESETQIFLATASGAPAAITVIRRPGQPPRWGVSWSELIDQSALAPAKETASWFRLACTLPRDLPADTNAAADPADRARAEEDYRLVMASLGQCTRNLE